MEYILSGEIGKKPFKRGVITVILSLLFFIVFASMLLDFEMIYSIVLILGIILFHGLIIFLIYIANKRFLSSVKYDSESRMLGLFSIFNNIKTTHKIPDIKEIKIIKSQGFGNYTNGFRNKNLVIKLKKSSQPQIYEIRNSEDFNKAEMIVNMIKTAHNRR
jgi:hypothetical protein